MKMYIKKHLRTQPKSFHLICVILMATLLNVGCKGNRSSANSDGESIPFEIIAQGSQSNIKEAKQVAINDTNELNSVFNKINATRKPGITIPSIDFSTKTVALVTAGESSTGGFAVTVDKVIRTEEQVIVHVRYDSPEPGSNVITVITTPFTMISFENTGLPVVFERVEE